MSGIELRSVHLYVDLDHEIWASPRSNWDELEKWAPPDRSDFEVFAYLDIGPSDQEGSDTFNLVVLSRKYYDEMAPKKRQQLRTRWKFIILETYDWQELWSEISKRLQDSDRGNWPDCLAVLRTKFSWEFENYNKPSPPELN